MKISITVIFIAILSTCNLMALPSEAVTETIGTSQEYSKNKIKKKGLKSFFVNRLIKKLKKINEQSDEIQKSKKRKRAVSGLVIGIISFILLFVGLAAPILWILAMILALIADFLCIRLLLKTKEDQENFKKERKISTIGLIFALATGVLPLFLLFLLWFISLTS